MTSGIPLPTRQRSQADQHLTFDTTLTGYCMELLRYGNEIISVKHLVRFWNLTKGQFIAASSQSNSKSSNKTQGEQSHGTCYYMPSRKATLLGLTFGLDFTQKERRTGKVGSPLTNMLNVLHDSQKSDSHMLTWI